MKVLLKSSLEISSSVIICAVNTTLSLSTCESALHSSEVGKPSPIIIKSVPRAAKYRADKSTEKFLQSSKVGSPSPIGGRRLPASVGINAPAAIPKSCRILFWFMKKYESSPV